MYSARDDTALPVPGFPIRESAGQRLFSTSPRLIAAVHALPRLLMPRHPPCALTILTVIVDRPAVGPSERAFTPAYNGDLYAAPQAKPALRRFRCLANCAVFKVRRGRNRRDSPAGLSKLSSASQTRERAAAPGPVDVSGRPAAMRSRSGLSLAELPRKEVIQPHLPVRLPCYDFTPITSPTFDGSLPRVGSPASGVARFRGVTGGVYKTRERIHPGIADPGLLATPPSWRRVSASNPNRDRLFGIRSTSRYRSPLYRPM